MNIRRIWFGLLGSMGQQSLEPPSPHIDQLSGPQVYIQRCFVTVDEDEIQKSGA